MAKTKIPAPRRAGTARRSKARAAKTAEIVAQLELLRDQDPRAFARAIKVLARIAGIAFVDE